MRLDECVQAIVRAVERRGMKDLVLVGHGVGGMIAAQAASLLPEPPRRLAMIAGVVPEKNRTPLSRLPGPRPQVLLSRHRLEQHAGQGRPAYPFGHH